MSYQAIFSATTLRNMGEGLLRAYAAILFSDRLGIGLLFLAASFWFPNAGMAGLVGAVTGSITVRLLSFPYVSSGLHVYNSLLVGLALGIAFKLDAYLLVLIVLGAILAVFLTVALADILWRVDHLPALSLPFVIVVFTCFFAAQAYGNLSVYLFPSAPVDILVGGWLDAFLIAMGSVFFTPHPMAGLLFFIGLLWTSRYLALLAVLGFFVGDGLLYWLSGSVHVTLGQWGGFNFILTSLVIGGVYTVPSWQSFLLAMTAAALSSLVTMAVQGVLLVYGLPVLAIPFLFTSLTLLAALRKRISVTPPYLLLEAPALPEQSYERSRLFRARGTDLESIPLCAPFFGTWCVYQGFNGSHTHQPPWQYALDFIITEKGRSYCNNGLELEDYYCFDLPVLSPCYGTVVRRFDELADHPLGEIDNHNNWGNFLLILLDSGFYVLLAHLRQHSITVIEGERLFPGQVIARCGNTGRSPQPHLHMHIQETSLLGSPTHPFYLLGVILGKEDKKMSDFQYACQPEEGERVSIVKLDGDFRRTMHLPIGLQFHFRFRINLQQWTSQSLTVCVDLLGGFRLQSSRGASVKFMEQGGALFFFERTIDKDPLLDLWLLALGLTPLADAEMEWADRPSDRLLPLPWFWSGARNLVRPLGGGLDSHYHRTKDKTGWQQQGHHCLQLFPGIKHNGISTAVIVPERGCTQLSLKINNILLEAELEEVSTIEDQGIPQTRFRLIPET